MKERQEIVSHMVRGKVWGERDALCILLHVKPIQLPLPVTTWEKFFQVVLCLGYTEGKTGNIMGLFRARWYATIVFQICVRKACTCLNVAASKGSRWHFTSMFSFLKHSLGARKYIPLLDLDRICCKLTNG